MPEDPHRQGQHALKQADLAARRGDLAAAERWSKTAQRMGEAARVLAAASNPPENHETGEAIRAELRERFRRLAVCDHAVQDWEREREAHERLCAQARSSGAPLPPPLTPVPFTDDHLDRIVKGEA